MNTMDLSHFENRLLEERDQTLENIQQAEAEEHEGLRETAGEIARAPSGMADLASDTQEVEKDWANIHRGSDQLTRIDEALRLLRDEPEAYGTCAECGNRIEAERLEMVPWTRHCMGCVGE